MNLNQIREKAEVEDIAVWQDIIKQVDKKHFEKKSS